MSLVPNKGQWSNLNTLEKWGVLAAIATCAGLFFTIYVWSFPKEKVLSISEKITIDENPTKIEINGYTFEKWIGDDEEYLTIAITNSSDRTASNIHINLTKKGELWRFSPSKTSEFFQLGFRLSGQSTMRVPIAPKSEFLKKFTGRCGICDFRSVKSNHPFPYPEMRKCSFEKKPSKICNSSSSIISFIVQIEYETIFGDTKLDQTIALARFINEYK